MGRSTTSSMFIGTLWEEGRGIRAENSAILCWLERDIGNVPPLTGARLKTVRTRRSRQHGDNCIGCLMSTERWFLREMSSSRGRHLPTMKPYFLLEQLPLASQSTMWKMQKFSEVTAQAASTTGAKRNCKGVKSLVLDIEIKWL